MVSDSKPRRGSLAYYPRKRAKSIVARIRSWPSSSEVKPLAFAGYKVGMVHVVLIEDNPNSPYYGREIVKAATVIECPPLMVCGIRVYSSTPYGLRSLSEIWAKGVPKDLTRVFTLPKEGFKHEEKLKEIKAMLDRISQVRLIVCTQPRKAGISKKKPEVFEIALGGSADKALEYALSKLGKELSVKEFVNEGQYVDVISITKGKGFASVVKRFGVKILPRWHKHRKGHRRIGSVGPTKPGTMFSVPRPGQLGFQQRTEYNKRVLKVGENPDEINPAGGFKHYGVIKSQYLLVEGSVPSPPKRLVKLRRPIRPLKGAVTQSPKLVYVSTKPIGR